MKSFLLYAPHLNRDPREILARVPDVQILTGERTFPGEVGCLQQHQRAVSLAVAAQYPYIFVMEDDCMFTEHFDMQKWIDIADSAYLHCLGAVHGATVRCDNPRTTEVPGLLRVNWACSAHCIIYTAYGYESVLRATQPLDITLARHTQVGLVWPFVAVQRPGLSGIGLPTHNGISETYQGEQHVDYVGMFKMQEEHLGRALGLGQQASN